MNAITRVNTLKTSEEFREYLKKVDAIIPFDEELSPGNVSPLGKPFLAGSKTVGNRFSILPMEGWDAETDGRPNDLVRRRWRRFGLSGAKLIWGGEAVAVRHDGRANPNQLVMQHKYLSDFISLREEIIQGHIEAGQNTADLLIGLQLTHSGRFARPNDKKKIEPRILYRHPIVEKRYPIEGDHQIFSDDELSTLIDDFITAAKLAHQAGFDFVDVKHCHGYLGHEFLSAVDRKGKFGGSFENRTRFLREVVAGINSVAPGLLIGVRLSAFDTIPFKPGADGIGEPEAWNNGPYPYAWGGDGSIQGVKLEEPIAFLKLCLQLGIPLVCTTFASPYYNPHVQRPALFPPSDGYLPPEDPLVGVARHIAINKALKEAVPEMMIIGSGFSYLQDWLPKVAQAVVGQGMVDSVGLGRMVLSYPDMPLDILAGKPLDRKRICRTFSDCTTAPRNGLISGCFPLDPFYKNSEAGKMLSLIKKAKG